MMRSLLRSVKPVRYSSVEQCESKTHPGVTFEVRRISLGRRIALAEQIRELGGQLEFHSAGDGMKDKIESSLLSSRINAIYLRWGLGNVCGMTIDGQPPDADLLIGAGPEDLTQEIVARIKSECGLSAEERKN